MIFFIFMGDLTDKQREFCYYYSMYGMVTKAGRKAGLTRGEWQYLMKRKDIKNLIKKLKAKQNKKIINKMPTLQALSERLSVIAFSSLKDIYDDKGNIKKINEMDEAAAAIKSIVIGDDYINISMIDAIPAIKELLKLHALHAPKKHEKQEKNIVILPSIKNIDDWEKQAAEFEEKQKK